MSNMTDINEVMRIKRDIENGLDMIDEIKKSGKLSDRVKQGLLKIQASKFERLRKKRINKSKIKKCMCKK